MQNQDMTNQNYISTCNTRGIQQNFILETDAYSDITNDGTYLYLCSESGNVYQYDPIKQVVKTGFPSGISCANIQITINGNICVIDNQVNNKLCVFNLEGKQMNSSTIT